MTLTVGHSNVGIQMVQAMKEECVRRQELKTMVAWIIVDFLKATPLQLLNNFSKESR